MPNYKGLDRMYIDIAKRISLESKANRRKVAAVLVKDGNIISFGWNGTPPGFDNKCEGSDGETLPIVIHAEMNAYAKAARLGISTFGSVLYLTLSPCYNCSKMIIQAKTKRVVYYEEWKNDSVDFLARGGVVCEKI